MRHVLLTTAAFAALAMGAASGQASSKPPCVVPSLAGKNLPGARAALHRAHCRAGKIRHRWSLEVPKGRVISQMPRPGTALRNRGRVNLAVSKGRKPTKHGVFTGRHAGGGTVTFHVGSDGTLSSFRITDIPGKNCTTPAWGVDFRHHGLPISGGNFDYTDPVGSYFRGRIHGSSASGTLRFAVAIAHCTSKALHWSAKTG